MRAPIYNPYSEDNDFHDRYAENNSKGSLMVGVVD
jgi:hypothetical protein